MTMAILPKHLKIIPGICGGKPRIRGHRITVQSIAICLERMGMSPDEIASEYDLSLGDVHVALAYYFDHQAQIDRTIEDEEAIVEELRERIPSILARKLEGLRGRPTSLSHHAR